MRLALAAVSLMLVSAACRGDVTSANARPVSPLPGTMAPQVSTGSCGDETTVVVPGRANVFGAGIDELPAPGGGGGGEAPICITLPASAATITVPRTWGSLSFTPLRAPELHFHKCPGGAEAVLAYGPDGDTGGCPGEVPGGTILPAGVVSGIASEDRVGYLTGVFLPARWAEPSPPPMLDFEGRYDFDRLAPRLGQLFFIGDGRTDDGVLQRFQIPAHATRLYLGIADAWGSGARRASTTTIAGTSGSGSASSSPTRGPPF